MQCPQQHTGALPGYPGQGLGALARGPREGRGDGLLRGLHRRRSPLLLQGRDGINFN